MPILEKSFSPEKYTAMYSVDEKFDGLRLDQFIKEYLPSFSREVIKRKIKSLDVCIIGRPSPHRPSSKVYYQEKVEVKIVKTNHEDELWRGNKLKLETAPKVVFENDLMTVVGKPAFMSTHPTGKHLFNCVTVFLESELKRKTYSVHRLDRETSGLLIQGKTPESSRVLTDFFEQSRVKKAYFFISKIKSKEAKKNEFTARERLDSTNEGLKRVYIDWHPFDSTLGKSAETKFKILFKNETYALGLAFPKTGRQHQIRVHAMVHGYPLLGDKLYLGSFKMFQRFKDGFATTEDHDLMEIPRHALHAVGLKIPNLKDVPFLYCPLPSDLEDWIKTNLPMHPTDLDKLVKKELHEAFSSPSE
jgi:RluA family pseudouridine synthase